MAKALVIRAIATFLLPLCIYPVLLAEGRWINSLENSELVNPHRLLASSDHNEAKQIKSSHQNLPGPTTKASKNMKTSANVVFGNGNQTTANKSDFHLRPPRRSLESGHVLAAALTDSSMQRKEHGITGTYSFKPTTQGDSPGAGHQFEGKTDIKIAPSQVGESAREKTQERLLEKNDEYFQPTGTTGRNSGAGHIFKQQFP